jgi:two-component system sensor histidine kinase PilS (NtrC family)
MDTDTGSAANVDSASDPRTRDDPQHGLVILMAARLALSLVSFVVALVLDATVADFTLSERRGFYGTVAFAFLATAAYGVMLPRVRHQRRFAAFNIAADVAIVTALVYLSGGRDSPFTFLYVLVGVYAAVLFDRFGALATAAAASVAYGAVLLAGRATAAPTEAPIVGWVVWGVHSAAVVLGAALASFLAAELRRADAELARRDSELRRLRGLYQRTFESLMSGLLTIDLEGRITSFNPEAESITGVAAGEAVGREGESVLPGLHAEVIGAADDGQGAGARARMRFRNLRGIDLHLGIAAYILKDESGDPSGHVVIFQDVTQVVEMEGELRRSERMAAVGQLSASLAHEVRNPLAAISGSIQMLQGRLPDFDGSREPGKLMDIALREIDRLDRLIADFLGYARPGPLNLRAVGVAGVLEDVFEIFEAVRSDTVEVHTDLEADLGVRADPDQLRQVLWNLVINAAQAMPGGGVLAVSGRRWPCEASQENSEESRKDGEDESKLNSIEIAVADEGVGIAADDLARIFDPFFTTKREGSGLGLATVHRIVANHGGSVRVESKLGAGTTIRVRLPRTEGSE